jgi:hypothetical protein
MQVTTAKRFRFAKILGAGLFGLFMSFSASAMNQDHHQDNSQTKEIKQVKKEKHVEQKVECKEEAKQEQKVECKEEPKVEQKVEQKIECNDQISSQQCDNSQSQFEISLEQSTNCNQDNEIKVLKAHQVMKRPHMGMQALYNGEEYIRLSKGNKLYHIHDHGLHLTTGISKENAKEIQELVAKWKENGCECDYIETVKIVTVKSKEKDKEKSHIKSHVDTKSKDKVKIKNNETVKDKHKNKVDMSGCGVKDTKEKSKVKTHEETLKVFNMKKFLEDKRNKKFCQKREKN